jgi:hypothetical protein
MGQSQLSHSKLRACSVPRTSISLWSCIIDKASKFAKFPVMTIMELHIGL